MLPIMILAMLVGFALSIPVAIALGLAGLIGMAAFTNLPLLIFPQQLYVSLDSYPLVAVPLFILAGNLMEAGGISRRLVNFAVALVGGMRGGLASACVVTCMIFAAISGSSVATTFAVGAIMIPALSRHGYPKPFATSLQAASAELGVIIPPSVPMILYAVSADVSIADLFLAGLGPGFLIAGALILLIAVWVRIQGVGMQEQAERPELLPAVAGAAASLTMPVVILGGIYGGIFTPTEAGAVAVFYAIFIGIFVHRELGPADLVPVLRRSMLGTASIMLIISAAGAFSYLINRAGVPAEVGSWLVANIDNPLLFLLGLNLLLFVVGMFLETSASIVILTPILVPVAVQFGVDPVHFGMILIVNLALGMITPPFGVNLFAACQVAQIPMEQVILPLLVFVAVVAACLLLITYIPAISLFLIR